MQRTCQTRYRASPEEDFCLQKCATHFSKVKHSLLKDTLRADGDTGALNTIKRAYLKRYQITSRQYNAIRAEVLGLIKGTKEFQKAQASNLQEKIAVVSVPPEERKGRKKYKETLFQKHQRHRQIGCLNQKLENLKSDMKTGVVHITFGTKNLFKARQHLIESGYTSPDGKEDVSTWKKDWCEGRENQFFILGSKDETGGNESCTAVQTGNKIQLRIRLPKDSPQKYLILKDIYFNKGHEKIILSIQKGIALSYRFLKDKKSWKIFVSFDLPEVPFISIQDSGRIGVDINSDHLAVVEVNRHGNRVAQLNIPMGTYGKSSKQTKAIVGEGVKILLAHAVKVGKPIAIEDLDFQKKKATLKYEYNAKYARMLSSFAYSQITSTIKARAFDCGIEIFSVNPAYTSVIGKVLFQRPCGMSGHQGAAMVIGRRSMKFRERMPSSLQVTLFSTRVDQKRHVWSLWAAYVKRKVPVTPASSLGKPPLKRSLRKEKPPVEEFGSVCTDAEQANEWVRDLLTSAQNGSEHAASLKGGYDLDNAICPSQGTVEGIRTVPLGGHPRGGFSARRVEGLGEPRNVDGGFPCLLPKVQV